MNKVLLQQIVPGKLLEKVLYLVALNSYNKKVINVKSMGANPPPNPLPQSEKG